MKITFQLNEEDVSINVPPHLRVSALLRELGDVSNGSLSCRDGECGKCLILLDDNLIYACLLTAFEVRNRKITTHRYWAESTWMRYFVWTQAMHKLWLCDYCKDSRFLAMTYLLQSTMNDEQQFMEVRSLVRCSCLSDENFTRMFQFMKKLRDRYAK